MKKKTPKREGKFWLRTPGCGVSCAYYYRDSAIIHAIVQKSGDWYAHFSVAGVYLTNLKTLANAKKVVETHFSERGSKAAKRPGASAAPRRLTEPKARSISRER
jgi:copper homeostasis protein CutC